MDLTSIVGFALGVVNIIIGILVSVGFKPVEALIFYDLPSVFITIGGTTFAVVMACSRDQLLGIFKAFPIFFRGTKISYEALINDFRRFAEIARKEGVLALDNVTKDIKDPFLVRAIQLAVDGVDPAVIEDLLNTELDQVAERHSDIIGALKKVAAYGPSYGMIGTLIGLVVMLKNLNDPAAIGPAMAVAIITTFYGALLAFLIATPIAEKLEYKDKMEMLEKQLVIKGITSIQSGDNPRMVVQKLKLYLPPKLREALK